MMRSFWVAAMLVLTFTSQSFAQATVKAGEHSDFSRLVVYFPTDQSWVFKETATGYEIALADWKTGFETSTVFNLIPRTRISALSADPSVLKIELACECVATAVALERGGAIIDVREGVDENRSLQAEKASSPDLPRVDRTTQEDLFVKALKAPENTPEYIPELEAFRRSLLENLGRSASLSLVDLDLDKNASSKNRNLVTSSPTISVEAFRRLEETGRLRITSALEAAASDQRQKPVVKREMICPASANFDILAWGDGGSFGDQLAQARNDILAEFDEPNIPAIRSLAQFYLYFGLGAEAKVIMSQFELLASDRSTVTDLANILEPPLFPEESGLVEFVNCDAKVAIWAMLAREDAGSATAPQIKAVMSEFAAWPRHLRSQLGPKLVTALMSSGEQEAADVVSSIIIRPGAEAVPELTLVAARASDHQAYSADDLLAIVDAGGDEAPEALLYFLQRAMENDQPIDAGLLELASAFAKELGGLPVGVSLRNLNVLALAYSGKYLQSLGAYQAAHRQSDPPGPEILDKLVAYFVDGSDIDSTVRIALLLQEYGKIETLKPEIAEAVIHRLIQDGLPNLAALLVNANANEAISIGLAADLARAMDKPDEAIAILREVSDESSTLRRADIMLDTGKASALWDQMNDSLSDGFRNRVAWGASQWSEIKNDGPKGRVAELMITIPEVDLDTAPLSGAEALRNGSRDTRNAITDLLKINPS